MSNLTYDDMISLVQNHAKATNTSRFSLDNQGRNKTFSKGRDKNNLSKERRAEIEAIKDRKLYPDDTDLFE